MSVIEPGCIVRIHSLQSSQGRKLNGQRADVLRGVENGRFQVKVEFDCEDSFSQTKAILPEKTSARRTSTASIV